MITLKIKSKFIFVKITFDWIKKDGSLNDIIESHRNAKKSIPNEKILFWSIQLLKGIDFLHSNKIWHRDIKPKNLFLHHNDLVLGDLGLARDAKSIVSSGLSTGMGTISYMAPEIVEESTDYTEKIDIW